MKASERSAQIAGVTERVQVLESDMRLLAKQFVQFKLLVERVEALEQHKLDGPIQDWLVEVAQKALLKSGELDQRVANLESPPAQDKWGSGWAWAGAILATGAAGLAVYHCNQRKVRTQEQLHRAPTAEYETTK